MRKFFFLLICVSSLISCGEKKKVREVLEYGTEDVDGITFSTETYLENDSAFDVVTNKATGKIFCIKSAASQQNLKDSTYSVVYYYLNGGVFECKSFKNRKPVGEWKTYYESGATKSKSAFSDGEPIFDTLWWENGKVNVAIKYSGNKEVVHNEFFIDGSLVTPFKFDTTATVKSIDSIVGEIKKNMSSGNLIKKSIEDETVDGSVLGYFDQQDSAVYLYAKDGGGEFRDDEWEFFLKDNILVYIIRRRYERTIDEKKPPTYSPFKVVAEDAYYFADGNIFRIVSEKNNSEKMKVPTVEQLQNKIRSVKKDLQEYGK